MFRRRSVAALACGMSLLAVSTMAEGREIVRNDRFIELESGGRLFVREVRRAGPETTPTRAVLLVHGARVPGIGSFDLPVAGGSLASDLAGAGYVVYLLDLRGYGESSRPIAMEGAPERGAPQIRTADAVADIGAAVEAIATWSGDSEISLIGWATGGHWAGAYASRNPSRVERLIVYNSLYGDRRATPRSEAAHPSTIGRAPEPSMSAHSAPTG